MINKRISVKYIEYKRITNIKDYYNVSRDRWKNAVNCFNNKDYFAALYLAGYSIECLLKYVIIQKSFNGEDKQNNGLNLPEACKNDKKYKALSNPNHNISKLINLGNDTSIFVAPKESEFKSIIEWKSEWRYAINHNINSEDIAKVFLSEAIELSKQLKDNVNDLKISEFKMIDKDVS